MLKKLNNMDYAPIVLFVYNRPWHTLQTLEAIAKNELADKSTLYIFSDGVKSNTSEIELKKIEEVRDILQRKQWCEKVHIIERKDNIGLANSVISGVSDVINKHKKVIVLEDDIITSSYFLRFMNSSLNFYEKKEKVMQVSGFQYTIDGLVKNKVYLHRRTTSWGWATWSRSWKFFIEDINTILKRFSNKDKYIFNIDGTVDRYRMLLDQKDKKIDSWAIRWAASVHLNSGLVVWPEQGLVKNIGFDGSGVHCEETQITKINFIEKDIQFVFSKKILENRKYLKLVKKYYSNYKEKSISNKIKFHVRHYLSLVKN